MSHLPKLLLLCVWNNPCVHSYVCAHVKDRERPRVDVWLGRVHRCTLSIGISLSCAAIKRSCEIVSFSLTNADWKKKKKTVYMFLKVMSTAKIFIYFNIFSNPSLPRQAVHTFMQIKNIKNLNFYITIFCQVQPWVFHLMLSFMKINWVEIRFQGWSLPGVGRVISWQQIGKWPFVATPFT